MKYALSEIAKICGGEFKGVDSQIELVSTDSRNFNLSAKTLFVAIRGANHDGHSFIEELYRRGIRAFIVEQEQNPMLHSEAGVIKVDNAVEALQKLAAHHRNKFNGKVVAVTGSNGKTVVKEWIADMIPSEVKLFRSPKSYNSQIGVPLSILMLEGDEEIAVIEAGISMPNEMDKLETIIRPDIGIITTVGDAHQENFGSLEQKVSEKLILFKDAKQIIYNSNYSDIEKYLNQHYSSKELVNAATQIDAYDYFHDSASQENSAIALTLCDILGYDHEQSVARLSKLEPVAMRLELKEGINNSLIINDSYNSDINSLSIALDYLSSVAGARKQTLIISDILQSGFSEKELYTKVAKLIGRSHIEKVIGIGEQIRNHSFLFAGNATFFLTTEQYLDSIKRDDVAERAILVKGSRTSQFERISHALERKSHTTTLEINLDAMIHNLNAHRALLKSQTKIMAMIKASGYGHGGYEVASMLQHQGIDYLAVAFADEGVALREKGITMPIVVLNADSDSFELMIANRLEPEIYNFTSLKSFLFALRRHSSERHYPIHIKIDTGMHRLGFTPDEIEELSSQLNSQRGLVVVSSIFSHLAVSDDKEEDLFTNQQINTFIDVCNRMSHQLGYQPIRHIANSAASERFPKSQLDMIRLGIGLYGISSLPSLKLEPVSTLKSRIVQIKKLQPNDTVGYGREGKISKPTHIATIPIGYADGLNRHLGNGKWSVMINNTPAPIIGRICMDTCMVDISGIDAKVGDSAIIYGTTTSNRIEDMAKQLDTISYEVMTSISARVKRIYLKE